MYFDALSFLEDEREAWAPFEALLELTDDDLERPTDPDGPAHGWAGRDLMAHLAGWQEVALREARELAVGETSPTRLAMDADWDARGADVINAEMLGAWRELPMAEVRRRFRETAGELRGYLTVVPEARWVKNPASLEAFLAETMDHYRDHLADLEAFLG